MKKYAIALTSFFIVCLILAVIAVIIWFCHPIRITVQNNSPKQIQKVTLKVGEQSVEFLNIKSGKKKMSWMLYKNSDSSFTIELEKSNGELMIKDFGYITHGPGYEKVFITVNKDGTLKLEHQL